MNKGIYKDKKGKWYIHTSFKGKSITIRGFYSKKEADENYEQAIEKWKREHLENNSGGEYERVLKEFFDFRERQITKQSVDKIRTHFRTYWSAIFRNQTIKNIFAIARLKILYENVISDNELNYRKKYNVIRCFLDFANYCYLTHLISEELYKEVKVIFQPLKENKQVENTKRYIPISHFKALYSHINKVNDKIFSLAISVLYFGGLRISELLGLLGGDIDNKIYVRRQLLTNGTLTTTLKTKNSFRSIPISQELKTVLENCTVSKNERIFPYSHTSFKRKLKQYEKEAKIPLYSCHEYRHSFCTNLASKCTNISDVTYCAKISGHTTSMFLNTYCKSLDEELEKKFF